MRVIYMRRMYGVTALVAWQSAISRAVMRSASSCVLMRSPGCGVMMSSDPRRVMLCGAGGWAGMVGRAVCAGYVNGRVPVTDVAVSQPVKLSHKYAEDKINHADGSADEVNFAYAACQDHCFISQPL